MSEKEILEGNKLIAEFMGGKFKEYSILNLKENEVWLPYHGLCNYQKLKYYSSWDWLIPVVEKIESISELSQNRTCNFHVTIEKHRCFIKWGIGRTICDVYDYHNNKILIVYRAVIEFIKWYNQNKKV